MKENGSGKPLKKI